MKLKVLVILAIFASSIQAYGLDIPCPCGWQKILNGCYKFVNKKVTWDVARADCRKRGGDLALPLSDSECQQLAQEARRQNLNRPWIGVFRRYDKQFITTCGEKLVYSNWQSGEPNNQGGSENCGHIIIHYPTVGKWNDRKCDLKYGYICEIKLPRCK